MSSALPLVKARARGDYNANFLATDMGELAFPDEGFDTVISAFSIFSAPDMKGPVRKPWRLVRPGESSRIWPGAPPRCPRRSRPGRRRGD
jgi:ubiquinone/menaquinone biosynthesis C-methylase UbiE